MLAGKVVTRDKIEKKLPEEERFGREIAFGIQQTLACWATDFIDPPISKYLQNRFGDKNHPVTDHHVWGGELAGDSIALFSYLGIKRFLSAPVDFITSSVKRMLESRLTRAGHSALQSWAVENGISRQDERYYQKLEAYKRFQAENMVDSAIVASNATLFNVAIQKLTGNGQRLGVILGSKVIGAFITMATMLGVRKTLPDATQTLDDELSKRYFSKVIRFAQKMAGIKPAKAEIETPLIPSEEDKVNCHAAPLVDDTLSQQKEKAFIAELKTQYAHGKLEDLDAFIERQKAIQSAFVYALNPCGAYARTLVDKHYKALKDIYNGSVKLIGIEISQKSIESILLNRRDEALGKLKLLEDQDFRALLNQSLNSAEPDQPVQVNQKKLIESLVQAHSPFGHEPAVHIYANARGQWVEHEALGRAFSDVQSLQALTHALSERISGNDASEAAMLFTQARRAAANRVVEALEPDGEVLNKALTKSASLRMKKKHEAKSPGLWSHKLLTQESDMNVPSMTG